MMTKAHFRLGLCLSMLFGCSGLLVSLLGESSLPEPLQEYLHQQRTAELTTTDLIVVATGLPVVGLGLASFIGLLRFSSWSRPVALGTWIFALFTLPFMGPTVEPGVTTAMFHLSSMTLGAVVAVAYWSPTVSGWFTKTPPNKPRQPTSGGWSG